MIEKSAAAKFVPKGWHTITPRIVAIDARRLVLFIKRVFDARGEYLDDAPSLLTVGDSMLMVSEADIRPPSPAFLYVYVPHADDTYRKAIESGARSLEEPTDQPYGDRRAMVADEWDNIWQIATHLRR